MILFLIFSVILVILLQRISVGRSLDALEVSMETDTFLVEQGEIFNMVITLRNHSRHFMPFLRLSFRLPKGTTTTLTSRSLHLKLLDQEEVSVSTWMAPLQQAKIRVPLIVNRRGAYKVEKLVIHQGDFLGLDEVYHEYLTWTPILAVPKPAPPSERTAIPGSFPGDLSVRRFLFEDPIFTVGFHEYTGREPMKSISWTATARTGRMLVKQFDHTMETSVAVILNVSSDADTREKHQELVECCYSLARTLCRQLEDRNIRYRVYCNAVVAGDFSFEKQVVEGSGSQHFRLLLEGLARCGTYPLGSSGMLFEQASRQSFHTCGILLITPTRDPDVLTAANRCAVRNNTALHSVFAEDFSGIDRTGRRDRP